MHFPTYITISDGGNSDAEAIGCSGGRRDNGCFSARFMWRREGAGELYTYLPPGSPENKAVCKVPPQSDCNDVFGASVGRGSFKFTPGKRTTIGQRVKLNDVGKANGELELFVDGKSMFTVPGLVLRTAESGRIRGIQMQSFFGGEWSPARTVHTRYMIVVHWGTVMLTELLCTGNDASWATPKDQNIFFGDFSVAITKKL